MNDNEAFKAALDAYMQLNPSSDPTVLMQGFSAGWVSKRGLTEEPVCAMCKDTGEITVYERDSLTALGTAVCPHLRSPFRPISLAEEPAGLRELCNQAFDALIWCSGASLPADGFDRIVRPVMKRLAALGKDKEEVPEQWRCKVHKDYVTDREFAWHTEPGGITCEAGFERVMPAPKEEDLRTSLENIIQPISTSYDRGQKAAEEITELFTALGKDKGGV